MDRVTKPEKQPRGYALGKNQRVEDVLAAEAELLRAAGVNPKWPGFDEKSRKSPGKHRDRRNA